MLRILKFFQYRYFNFMSKLISNFQNSQSNIQNIFIFLAQKLSNLFEIIVKFIGIRY